MAQREYYRDKENGQVIFNDVDAYRARRNVLIQQKLSKVAETSNKKVINTLRSEIKELKDLVTQLVEKG
jgi:paraquat-inducible protein B